MKAKAPLLVLSAGLFLIGASHLQERPWIIWNRTESVPAGLYLLTAEPPLSRGDLVAYLPEADERAWLEGRAYTGRGWPLIKRIAALEGDQVCRTGQIILINETPTALALAEDAAGRSLPAWEGCRLLRPGDIFLLADHPRSVDGRYFGVQENGRILGKVRLVWRWPATARACGKQAPKPAQAVTRAVIESDCIPDRSASSKGICSDAG